MQTPFSARSFEGEVESATARTRRWHDSEAINVETWLCRCASNCGVGVRRQLENQSHAHANPRRRSRIARPVRSRRSRLN
jgi:hypothetical protein